MQKNNGHDGHGHGGTQDTGRATSRHGEKRESFEAAIINLQKYHSVV